MPFPEGAYDRETLALMRQALDEAWNEAGTDPAFRPIVNRGRIGALMALRIMAAVKNGERDPERLKLVALTAIGGPWPGSEA